MFWRLAAVGTAIIASLATSSAQRRDSKAETIAQNMMQAMGGQDAWGRAHFVRYDFRVITDGNVSTDRAHLWDKQTGRYRLEDRTKDGKRRVVLFNVGNQQGVTYVDGKKIEGPAGVNAVKEAYQAFMNDTYWLAMPWRWNDQGVHLRYLGPRARHSRNFDVVQISFDQAGAMPADHFQAYVSPRSSLMEHCEYTTPDGKTGSWDWTYATTGGVKLASDHKSADGRTSINMGDVRVLDSVDGSYFTDAAKVLASLK